MLIPYNARTPSEQPPMILSKLHKFLFLKGRKVAGTSVEVFLSGICGPEDVITPITPIDEKYRIDSGYRYAQNYGADPRKLADYISSLTQATTDDLASNNKSSPRGRFKGHMTYNEICNAHTEPIPKDYLILAIARSPYQQIMSRLNHMVNFKDYKQSGHDMHSSPSEYKEAMDKFIRNMKDNNWGSTWDLCTEKASNHIVVSRFLRFERLESELKGLMNELGISNPPSLPHLKKGQNNPDEFIKEITNPAQLKHINQTYAREFELLGYKTIE